MTSHSTTSSDASPDWKADYIAEYKRTSGLTMTIGESLPGGYVLVSTLHTKPEAFAQRKLRKGQCIANTARLRERPDAPPEAHELGAAVLKRLRDAETAANQEAA
jgi:membrane carboxypeptidase/penicillin-binding protein